MMRSISSARKMRAFEAFFGGFAAELDGVLDVFVVRLLKRAGLDGVGDREDRVAFVHLRVIDDRHHGFELALGDVEDAAHVVLDVFAGDGVLREGGRRREDVRVWRRSTRRLQLDGCRLRRRFNRGCRRCVFGAQRRSPVSFGADMTPAPAGADPATATPEKAAPPGRRIPGLDSTLFMAGEVGLKFGNVVRGGM